MYGVWSDLRMRLSLVTISKLQELFLEAYGVKLSEEEAQQAGLKIIRFVYVKELRKGTKSVQRKP